MEASARAVAAIYHPIEDPVAYAGNPLIEALPHILSIADVMKLVQHQPTTNRARETALASHERVHCVSAIDDLVLALPEAFEVESDLSIMLRRGYAARNPIEPAWRRERLAIYEEMATPLRQYEVCAETVSAMMVTGVSGSGKTTLVRRLLGTYPQVIAHHKYAGGCFETRQVVWIAVSASFDASLRGLVLSMFGAIDSAVGTSYRMQYEKSKHTIDSLIGNLAKVFLQHHLGVLMIDECQCLQLRGKDEAQLALNLFLKISNVCRIPLIFVGTYAASALFATVARNARRVCSGGYTDLALPDRWDAPIWKTFVLEPVWERYQWVPSPQPLSEEIGKLYFKLTQGLMAVFIALHRASQVYAIRRNLPTVTAEIIQKVYNDQFVLLHPALEALRSGKVNKLEKFEDLLPPKEQLANLLRPTQKDLLDERLAMLREDRQAIWNESEESSST